MEATLYVSIIANFLEMEITPHSSIGLKHRENKKSEAADCCVFIGSPIVEEKDALVKIAKKLKKNNVAVDIVSFGCEEENKEKLEAFQAAVNSGDNSHLVSVPAGTILSDMLFATPIFMEEGGTDTGGGAAAAAPQPNIVDGFDYSQLGVDPTLDPELALALRISMEEERARVEAAAAEGNEPKEGEDKAAAVEEEPKEENEWGCPQEMDKEEGAAVDEDVEVDDPELALALQMSMGDQQQPPSSSKDEREKKKDKNEEDA
eukprot:jgi/Picre1/34115/NNA_001590.t1